MPYCFQHLIELQVKPIRDHAHFRVRVPHLFPHHVARHGGVVVHQQTAFAVQQFAPWRQDRHLVHTVGLGKLPVVVTV